MADDAIERTAAWLRDAIPSDAKPAPDMWAQVEIFGHRRHYGRISEVERFGAKLLRIDVPLVGAAPLLGEPERFETHVYGGAAIFSLTPVTEEAAREHLKRLGRLASFDEAPAITYRPHADEEGPF